MRVGVQPGFDWSGIDTVLLDMDGTLLDLAFDNYFWREYLPAHYAELHGREAEEARGSLYARFAAAEGTLAWYCLDHWSRELGIDVRRLKRGVRRHIRFLPEAPAFLRSVRALGKRLVLVTNAHRDTLSLKNECTALHLHVDRMHSSHDFGAPKESPEFWAAFSRAERYDPARTLLVEDSLPVLRAAARHGIGRLVAIRRPDTRQPARDVDEFPAVMSVGDLIAG